MDDYGRKGRHRRGRAGIGGKLLLVGIVIVIILIAGFAYYFMGGPINIGGPTTVALSGRGSELSISGKSYVATLEGYNNDTQTAYVYVTSVPVFLGPILNVTLHQNSTVKVNYNSQFAIMQMRLVSAGRGSAEVQISPLAASLQVDPDYQYIGHPSVSLPGLHINVTTTVPAASTTTVAATSNGPSVTTTVMAATTTTTISAANSTQLAINAALASDPSYALMLNYSSIYSAVSGCTPTLYSNSYFERFAALPTGQVDYYNMSYETPTGLAQKTVSQGGGRYNVEFLALVNDPQFNGTAALTISLTVAQSGSSTVATVNSNQFGGIFAGATYSSLLSEYTQTRLVNNACAALVG